LLLFALFASYCCTPPSGWLASCVVLYLLASCFVGATAQPAGQSPAFAKSRGKVVHELWRKRGFFGSTTAKMADDDGEQATSKDDVLPCLP